MEICLEQEINPVYLQEQIIRNQPELHSYQALKSFYSKSSERFQYICFFLESNECLPDSYKKLLRIYGGEPFQNMIYKTFILNLEDLSPSSVFPVCAEIYHYQRLLNLKIERTTFAIEDTDIELVNHIYNEIAFVFPVFKELYTLDSAFAKMVHSHFMLQYGFTANSITSINAMKNALRFYFEKFYAGSDAIMLPAFLEVKMLSQSTDDTGIKFHQFLYDCFHKNEFEPNYSDITSENRYKQLLEISRKKSFFNSYPTKDELYMLCIALATDYQDFLTLQQLAAREQKDSTIYADNEYSPRDALIKAVIMDLHNWYDLVKRENPQLTIEAWPQTLLRYVDQLLFEHECRPLYGR